MKHGKALFISIWIIAIGIVFWISGSVIGARALILGILAIITTGIREYLDREKEPPQN